MLKEARLADRASPDRRARARARAPARSAAGGALAKSTASLTPWQRVLVARHPSRPDMLHYVVRLFTDFVELHGDRRFADDHAIVAGTACYKGEPVMVVGHHKGGDTKQKIYRNFGYARPEGYRKAIRLMRHGREVSPPDRRRSSTRPAAYPGVESEERGVAEAIAFNLREMSVLEVPIVVVITGEGGSGGASGIAIGDRILMQEYAIYSVIPPEGCAAILWRDSQEESGSGDGAQADGAGSARARHRRRDRPRTRWRFAYRLRRSRGAAGQLAPRWRCRPPARPTSTPGSRGGTRSSARWAVWVQILPIRTASDVAAVRQLSFIRPLPSNGTDRD